MTDFDLAVESGWWGAADGADNEPPDTDGEHLLGISSCPPITAAASGRRLGEANPYSRRSSKHWVREMYDGYWNDWQRLPTVPTDYGDYPNRFLGVTSDGARLGVEAEPGAGIRRTRATCSMDVRRGDLVPPPAAWTKLTQAEYDALSPPDPDTLYVIVG